MADAAQAEFAQTGQIIKAIFGILRDPGKVDDAAKLYTRCQEDIGYLLVNNVGQYGIQQKVLAKMFYVAKDFEKAALVFEQSGVFDKAAVLYAKGDDYHMAAEMYCRIEDFANAALMYEKHGSFNQAAELFQKIGNNERAAYNFEKAVNNYLAGKMYYQAGKTEKAIELLQKIGNSDTEYLDATVMIGQILAQQGFHDLAVRKYLTIAQNHPLGPDTMSLYYELGNLYLKLGKSHDAKHLFEQILTIDFNYKEAAKLLKQSQAGIAEVSDVVEEIQVLDDAPAAAAPAPAAAPKPAPAPTAAPAAAKPTPAEAAASEAATQAEVVSMMEGFEFLQQTPLFQELNLQEMRQFWMLFENEPQQAGAVIIQQDQPGKAFYILLSGKVAVERINDGALKKLAELGPGSFFGEMSLMDNQPTSATIRATEACEVVVVSREKFEQLMESNDRIALKVYHAFCRTLMDRLRQTNDNLSKFEKTKEKELASLFGA